MQSKGRAQSVMETRVERIPSLLRDIESGRILVPAFQRNFVWDRHHVLDLFDSIYRGYPIGSMLFWRTNERLFELRRDNNLAFPIVEDVLYPVTYVLDGVQRLSCLYGAFKWKDKTTPGLYNIVFDLRNEVFMHYQPSNLPHVYIHLSDVFSPRQLLDTQREFLNLPESDFLIERSVNLHTVIQEYQVPTVVVTGRDPSEMAAIFERLNTSGVALTTMDILAASVWAVDFDLHTEITEIQASSERMGFVLKEVEVARMITALLDEDISSQGLLRLRNYSTSKLHDAFEQLKIALSKTSDFLHSYIQLPSPEFVPSPAHLVILVKAFSSLENWSEDELARLSNWFWASGFNEEYRSSSDSVLAKAIGRVRDISKGNFRFFHTQLKVRLDDFLTRSLNKNLPFSKTVLAMFAVNKPRSIISGKEMFEMSMLKSEVSHIIPLHALESSSNNNNSHGRSWANTLINWEGKNRSISDYNVREFLISVNERLGDSAPTALESNFLSQEAIQVLREAQPSAFLSVRARILYDKAYQLSTPEK